MATVWLSLNDLGRMVKTVWSVATRKKDEPSAEDFRTVGEVVDYHLTGGRTAPPRSDKPSYDEPDDGDRGGSDRRDWGGKGWGRNGW